jgi:hypothetical protein
MTWRQKDVHLKVRALHGQLSSITAPSSIKTESCPPRVFSGIRRTARGLIVLLSIVINDDRQLRVVSLDRVFLFELWLLFLH